MTRYAQFYLPLARDKVRPCLLKGRFSHEGSRRPGPKSCMLPRWTTTCSGGPLSRRHIKITPCASNTCATRGLSTRSVSCLLGRMPTSTLAPRALCACRVRITPLKATFADRGATCALGDEVRVAMLEMHGACMTAKRSLRALADVGRARGRGAVGIPCAHELVCALKKRQRIMLSIDIKRHDKRQGLIRCRLSLSSKTPHNYRQRKRK